MTRPRARRRHRTPPKATAVVAVMLAAAGPGGVRPPGGGGGRARPPTTTTRRGVQPTLLPASNARLNVGRVNVERLNYGLVVTPPSDPTGGGARLGASGLGSTMATVQMGYGLP